MTAQGAQGALNTHIMSTFEKTAIFDEHLR
jgi:hypothetical protein